MDQHHPTGEENDGLWDWNLATSRIHYSPRWISLVGCEDHEVGTTPDEWLDRIHPDDLDQVLGAIDAASGNGPDEFSVRHRLRHNDGTYRWMSCRGVAVRSEAGSVVRLRGSHADVTASTVTDSLTGLPNHLLLLDRLNHSIERSRRYPGFRYALLLIDLGRPPGTTTGVVTGDPLLTTTARRLETCLRIGDATATLRNNDLVARMPDDRFAILLDGLKDVSHAKGVADRLLAEVLAPVHVGGRDLFLTASIGIAVSVTGYQQADAVLRDAEIAVHRAQVLGGSHCELFDTAILQAEQAELQLESDCISALERREFELFYQPIVSLASNRLVGFEALLRWKHPVLGLVAPQDFIPIAEKTGFIVPLGHWVLREACFRLKEWQGTVADGRDVWMSVNLSSEQLKHPALIDQVGDALRESALEPSRLVLELTEGSAMANPTSGRTVLMQVRALGVRISIDDFGTGYSSLAYLRQLPIDTLKIDRAFVRGMETQKSAADIVANMAAMAQQLGVHVVAEGIENEEQRTLLRSLQCDSGQGFFFAKPLDAEQAAEFIRTGIAPEPARIRDKNPTRTTEPDRTVSALAERLKPVRHRLAAAAAIAGLLVSAGIAGRFTVNDAESAPLLPPSTQEKIAAGMLASGARMRTSDVALVPIAAVAPTTPLRAQVQPEGPVPQLKSRAMAASAAHASAPTTASSHGLLRGSTSVPVAHLHRIGSCSGRLVVSDASVAFVPDDSANKDAFTFAYQDFLHAVAGDTLTIRTASRAFRFKPAPDAGEGDNQSSLRRVATSIGRFR